jgi:uncharacterized protein
MWFLWRLTAAPLPRGPNHRPVAIVSGSLATRSAATASVAALRYLSGMADGRATRDLDNGEAVEPNGGVREHDSPLVRGLLIAAGATCVALGVLGIFLPLLPTTPFMLLAAACFARSSRRFHEWLLSNRTFGPLILEWEKHRSIPRRTKLTAIALMSLTMAVSIVFFVELGWLQVLLAALGVLLAIWMYRIPSRGG